MKVVGLDVSTYVGMSLIEPGENKGKLIHFPKEKGFRRLQLIAQEVRRTLEVWQPDYAIVEGYAFGNHNSLVTLVECGTQVRNVLFDLKVPWAEVPPTMLKKWVTGSGNAKKDGMAKSVKERWGFVSFSDDIVDAFALAKMGETHGFEELCGLKGVLRGN